MCSIRILHRSSMDLKASLRFMFANECGATFGKHEAADGRYERLQQQLGSVRRTDGPAITFTSLDFGGRCLR